MTLHVHVDHELCISSGKCVGDQPDVFAFDDDQLAYVVAPGQTVERGLAIRAAQNCPSQAIILRDADGEIVDT